jgi:uncharacterized protein (UPF0332 family)
MIALERIKQARESMEEALLLSREHMGNKAVLTKLYHAMMNCLFAIFDVRDIGKLTHADLIERFEREYVNPRKIDRTILDVIRRTYDLTHECDCDHMPVPTDGELEAAHNVAEGLIRATERLLKTEVRS